MILSLMTFTSIICLPQDGCHPYSGPVSGLMPQFYDFYSFLNIEFLNWQVRAPWLPDWHRGGRGDGDQLETSAVQVREMIWWTYKLTNWWIDELWADELTNLRTDELVFQRSCQDSVPFPGIRLSILSQHHVRIFFGNFWKRKAKAIQVHWNPKTQIWAEIQGCSRR